MDVRGPIRGDLDYFYLDLSIENLKWKEYKFLRELGALAIGENLKCDPRAECGSRWHWAEEQEDKKTRVCDLRAWICATLTELVGEGSDGWENVYIVHLRIVEQKSNWIYVINDS